jgi:hypothetical protein
MKIIFWLLLLTGSGFGLCAQSAPADAATTKRVNSVSAWALYAEADFNLFPDPSKNILTLITKADRKKLHLEARYNYEDRNTASVFGGMNFTFGNELKFDLTPMAGIVFGRLNGAVPGLETDLSYRIFNFITQSEYIIDFAGFKSDYLYTYMQIDATMNKFALGMAAQKNKLYETRRDLQLGVFAQYQVFAVQTKLSYYNPFSTDYFFVATIDINF